MTVDPFFVFECGVRIAPAIKNEGVDIHLISDDFCLSVVYFVGFEVIRRCRTLE